jgi:hypothetical protein
MTSSPFPGPANRFRGTTDSRAHATEAGLEVGEPGPCVHERCADALGRMTYICVPLCLCARVRVRAHALPGHGLRVL